MLTLLAVPLVICASCRAAIVPQARLVDPVPVFVLNHGRHSSLVLPSAGGGLVRYSYGDWKYYALREQGARETTGAVLWPTAAAFGRRELVGRPVEADVRRAVVAGAEEIFEIPVERHAVIELQSELEALFAANLDGLVQNRAYDLDFVPHPERYHMFRNSNHMVARWLRRMGCRVSGPTLLSRWKVLEPE